MSIKEIRKELGVTQTEFARLFGVHQTAVSQWETGRTSPDTDMIIQIARGTGHTVDEVLGITQSPIQVQANKIEIKMPDDSMAGARIQKGDRVFVCAKEEAIADGSLIGIRKNGKDTVRFARRMDGEMYLLDARIPARIEKVEEGVEILGGVLGVYADFGQKDG